MFAEYFMSCILFLFPNCLLQYCNLLEIPSANMIYFSCVFIFKIIHRGGGGGKERVGPGCQVLSVRPEGRSRPYELAIIKTSLQPGIFSWPIVMAGNYVNKHGIFLERKKTHFVISLYSHTLNSLTPKILDRFRTLTSSVCRVMRLVSV